AGSQFRLTARICGAAYHRGPGSCHPVRCPKAALRGLMAKAKSKRKVSSGRPKPAPSKSFNRKKPVRGSKQAKVRTQSHPFPTTISTVVNEDLGRLTPAAAVELLRDLLWADARSVGIPTTNINVSVWADVPDGGIDASVDTDPAALKGSVIN